MERVVGVALIVVGVAVAVGGVILALAEPISPDFEPEFSILLAAPVFLAAALAVLVGIITIRSGRRR